MKSAEYWQKRSEQTLINNEKLAVEYQKEMAKIYEETKLQTEQQLEAFYQRYAKENKLDLADVRTKLNPKELKNFKTQQEKYLKEVNKLIEKGVTDLTPYNAKLKELSARAYVTKLQEIQNNLNSEIMLLTGQQQVNMTDVLKKSYLQGYLQTMYTTQKGLGFGMSFTIPSNDDVLKVLKTPWQGANYSTRIWNNKKQLTNWLNTDLPRHFASGSSIQQMTSDMRKKLDINKRNAERLIRTEVNHISNESSMDAYKNSGVVEQYEILATLDSRTSEICRDLDGKKFKLGEKKVSVNFPPFHPNCRTTTIPYFPEYESEEDLRVARDADGQTYTVPADMSYREWEKKYGEGYVTPKQEAKIQKEKQEEPIQVQTGQQKQGSQIPKVQQQTEQTQEVQAPTQLNYKELTQEQVNDWSNHSVFQLSDTNIRAIESYTGAGYRWINPYLRTGNAPRGYNETDLKKAIRDSKLITDSMSKLPEDTLLYRNINTEGLLGMITDNKVLQNVSSLFDDNKALPNKLKMAKRTLVGQIIEEKGFVSTSWIKDRYGKTRSVHLVIHARKGAKALPLEKISEFGSEKEVLLNKGNAFVIKDVRIEDGRLILDVYLKEG